MGRETPLVFRMDEGRYCLFPIGHPDVWELYKKCQASFWTAEEIDLASDDLTKLTENEQSFVKSVLAFFAFADGVVVENLAENFCAEVQWPEARSFYGFQIAMENVHAETYSLLIDHFASREEKRRLFDSLKHSACLRKKANWMTTWMRSDAPFAERLVAFACVEGIHFSAAFSSLFWCKKRALPLSGLLFSNELIARDEGMHCDFACLLFQKMWKGSVPARDVVRAFVDAGEEAPVSYVADAEIRLEGKEEDVARSVLAAFPSVSEGRANDVAKDLVASRRCDETTVLDIVRGACDVEFEFIRSECLPVRLIGMNADTAEQYVRFVANRLTKALGCEEEPYPGASNPYDWMELISLSGKTNFFERRVSDYQKAGVMSSLYSPNDVFTLSSDF